MLLALPAGAARAGTDATTAITLKAGTPIELATAEPLSSKTHAKGNRIALRVTRDVIVDGIVVIAAGTDAVGQISDSREKGGLGMTGKLAVQPLYLLRGAQTVRLAGTAGDTGAVEAGTVIGLALLPTVSGRSAVIPEGTRLPARIDRTVTLAAPK
jgi:hypothetical protein